MGTVSPSRQVQPSSESSASSSGVGAAWATGSKVGACGESGVGGVGAWGAAMGGGLVAEPRAANLGPNCARKRESTSSNSRGSCRRWGVILSWAHSS